MDNHRRVELRKRGQRPVSDRADQSEGKLLEKRALPVTSTAMITGIGVDVVQNERIRESIQKFGDRFLNRIYTEREKEYCENSANPAIHFAARWAAKEAAFKALGTGWALGVKWKDVEVERLSSGKPELILHGQALNLAKTAGANHYFVSLTHDHMISCAVVIFEST